MEKNVKKELQKIVETYREKGYPLSDKEAADIERYCYRKMEVAKVEDQKGYLPILFSSMINEYFQRMAINAMTLCCEEKV